MSKRIVVIGASELQNPLILRAKEMGYETHVFAWKAGDIGERTADRFYPVSITETEEILGICREIRPDAVCTIASDLAAIAVNRVANALGLPSNPPETAVIATNKAAMREAFRNAGIPVPAFVKTGPGEDLSGIRRMRFPIIVKPTDRSGSRGINKLASPEGLAEAVALAAGESFEKKAIAEEYLEGPEYSCECVSQGGKHHFLSITKKYTTGTPHFIETGHLEPAGLGPETAEKVREQVFRALDALHVTTGASHSEFKILPESGEIRLIEIGARMGGDCIGSDLVRLTTGIDFVGNVIRAAAGEPLDLTAGEKVPFAAVRYIFTREDLERFRETERRHPERIVRQSEIRLGGETVTDSSARAGFYIVLGNSAKEALEAADLGDE